jgi:hypothetical protein
MARAQTENFWDMVVEFETTGGNLPQAPVLIEGVSKGNPAVVSVGTGSILSFANGDNVTLGGVATPGFEAVNGAHLVSGVDSTTGTFQIDADTSTAATAAGAGGTVTPANPRPAPVPITHISNATPSVVTVGTTAIAAFKTGDKVLIAGVTNPGFSGINAEQTVGVVSALAGTFEVAFDSTGATGPANTGTAQGASPPNDQLVWSKVCGLTSRTMARTSTMQTSEVPDCDDESLPAAVERSVQSQDVQITGTGVWAAQSWPLMSNWYYSGKTKNVRVTNYKAPSGSIEQETGPAYLTTYSNTAAKGTKVTADITIEFDGLPQLTYSDGTQAAA